MAVSAEASFYRKALMYIDSEEDLVKREIGTTSNLITDLHELRIAALLFGSLEGWCTGKSQLLSCQHVGPVKGFTNSFSDSEQHTLLDLAVLLDCKDLGILLAEHDAYLSLHVMDHTVGMYLEHMYTLAPVLAAGLARGRFKEHMEVIFRKDIELFGEVFKQAILSGNAKTTSELAAVGAPRLLSAPNVFFAIYDQWERCESSSLLISRSIWTAAAHAGVDWQNCHIDIALSPSGWVLRQASILDVALLVGFVDAAFEFLKANVRITMDADTFVWACLDSRSMDDQDWWEGVPITPNYKKVASSLLQRAAAAAGRLYGVPLLQKFKQRRSLVDCVLDYTLGLPSALYSLASKVAVAPVSWTTAMASDNSPAAEVETVGMMAFDSRRTAEVEIPPDTDQPLIVEPEPKVPDAKENAELASVLKKSRKDILELSRDNVVLLRLTRRAATPEVLELLASSPLLVNCRRRVEEAGCEIVPAWAGGAKFFVPVTPEQLVELNESGFQVDRNHILALREDKAIIEKALKLGMKRDKRPRLTPEHGWPTQEDQEESGEESVLMEETHYSTDSELGFPAWQRAGSSGDAPTRLCTAMSE